MTVLAPDAIGFESPVGLAVGSGPVPELTRPGSTADLWLQYYNQTAHRLVRGDLLMRRMLTDWHAALTVLQQAMPAGRRAGVLGHSMGGGVALFLAALDPRVQFACSSGAAGSYRRKIRRGVPLDMTLLIPGFASELDIDDVMRCIAPRPLLIVSGEDDWASEDADELVNPVVPLFQDAPAHSQLQHLRVHGGHALDHPRFEAIVSWVVTQASGVTAVAR